METIKYSFEENPDCNNLVAIQTEGGIEGNSIVPSQTLLSGKRYCMTVEDGIIVYYSNAKIQTNLNLFEKKTSNEFMDIFYNLISGEDSKLSNSNFSFALGNFGYNFHILKNHGEIYYSIKAGTKLYVLCIFIKKDVIEFYTKKNNSSYSSIEKLLNISKSFLACRMSDESYHIVNDLRKLKTEGPIFDINLMATIYLLLSNYIKNISTQKTTFQNINEDDLKNIISIKQFLIANIEGYFPSIKLIADKVKMSEAKLQRLFKKTTGKTVNSYFLYNKLMRAKELLEENELSISEIASRLSFTNSSHFASKFKKEFGILPKEFIKNL
jgi:AraC-like DNA-binding protein